MTFDLKIKKKAKIQNEDVGGSEKPVILLIWPKGPQTGYIFYLA